MRQLLLGWLAGASLATIGLVVARALEPGRHALELDIYLLVLGGLAVAGILSWLRRSAPPARESALHRALEPVPEEPSRLPDLARLEREVVMSAAQAFDLHYRLRPTLREIAHARLAEHGLRLDDGGPEARTALGDELWEIVRAERPAPADRHGGGLGLEGIRRLVARLEGAET